MRYICRQSGLHISLVFTEVARACSSSSGNIPGAADSFLTWEKLQCLRDGVKQGVFILVSVEHSRNLCYMPSEARGLMANPRAVASTKCV